MKKLLLFTVAMATLLAGSLRAEHDHGDFERDRHPDRREWIGRISGVVRDCDQRATEFRTALARALNHSRLDGTREENHLNEAARRLDHAIDRLRETWNRDRDPERSRRHVREAIEASRSINWALETHQVHGRVQGEWEVLRGELNRLAEVFNEPRIHWEH